MGLLANYPIALASGMGENFFFLAVATGSVTGTAVGWRAALAAVFASGVLFLGLGAFRVRERIFEAIPSSLKDAIATGIGFFIAFIGLKEAGLIVAAPGTLVRLGHLGSPSTLLALGGLVLTVGLHVRGNPGAILFGILATAAGGHGFSVHGFVRHRWHPGGSGFASRIGARRKTRARRPSICGGRQRHHVGSPPRDIDRHRVHRVVGRSRSWRTHRAERDRHGRAFLARALLRTGSANDRRWGGRVSSGYRARPHSGRSSDEPQPLHCVGQSGRGVSSLPGPVGYSAHLLDRRWTGAWVHRSPDPQIGLWQSARSASFVVCDRGTVRSAVRAVVIATNPASAVGTNHATEAGHLPRRRDKLPQLPAELGGSAGG